MQAVVVERQIGKETLRLETGKLAKQAHGAVLVQYGGSVVLTASVEGSPRGTGDFFPLTVDYRERTYAAGKFPGGFKKREGAPTLKEILTMRLTDRPIRPLFPENYFNEVQIQTIVLSSDRETDTDVLSMNGASASLFVSHMPFRGPIGAVRVGRIDKELIVFPTNSQLAESDLDLVVAGHADQICMIEGFGKEIPEEEMAEAIAFAHSQIRLIIEMQKELRSKCGLGEVAFPPPPDTSLVDRVREKYFAKYRQVGQTASKVARAEEVAAIDASVVEEFAAKEGQEGPSADQVKDAAHRVFGEAVRDLIVSGTRLDGRGAGDLRNLYSEVGFLPRTHGSALFQRGETQCLMVATLGSTSDEQRVDGLFEEYSKKFMLDYNFPPFSVGECKPIRGPGRRELGHGALAERSLQAVFPPSEKFPYTLRLVAEILESNGSSSMATVCAGTLCMMDAGVPIKDPVAGISIGLVYESEDRFILLTDIMGDEDHFGDMDFKVAGTQRGITGIQLDLKISGISQRIIVETLQQARKARIDILRHMLTTLKRPNKEISEYAPRLIQVKINPEKIGMLIGPGGKNIRALQEGTKTQIDINDDGTVSILGADRSSVEDARNRVEAMTEEIKVGRVYKGKVAAITDFGAFVEIAPGRDGLCHISELDHGYVNRVTDICQVGDQVEVQVIAIDDHDRVKLSRKVLLPKPQRTD